MLLLFFLSFSFSFLFFLLDLNLLWFLGREMILKRKKVFCGKSTLWDTDISVSLSQPRCLFKMSLNYLRYDWRGITPVHQSYDSVQKDVVVSTQLVNCVKTENGQDFYPD